MKEKFKQEDRTENEDGKLADKDVSIIYSVCCLHRLVDSAAINHTTVATDLLQLFLFHFIYDYFPLF